MHVILLNVLSFKGGIFIMELKLILKEKVWSPKSNPLAGIKHHYPKQHREEFALLKLLHYSLPQMLEARTEE